MELLRKFHMADAPGGSPGPSESDIQNARDLKEEFILIKDTIGTVGAEIDRSLTQKISTFSGVAKQTAENTLKSLTAELNRASKGVDKTRNLSEDLSKKFISSKKIQESINVIKTRQANIESTLLLLERQGVELSNEDLENIEAANQALNQQIGIEEELLAAAQKREKAAGNIGKLFQELTKIPILGSLIDAEAITKRINKTAEESGSRWKSFGAGISETFKSIGKSLTDPTTLVLGLFTVLKKVVDLVIQFNQKTFDLAKNLGTTVDEASTLQNQFIDMANSSANIGLRGSEIAKTYAEISNSLGFMAPANREFAETATLIQKRIGASAEDMSALALQATLSGKTLEETMGTLNASRNIEGARNKLLLSQKQILDGIAKTSAAVLINFKGDVGALGDAIVRATKLGTTLDTINKQGESLLDFESSISAEFEAQLLTGREINLTRARELALQGETAELGEELNRQGATYQQFMNENIIARQADAKAIGLSVEEYSKILLQQQQANRLGAEQGKTALETYNRLVQNGATQEDIIKKLGSEQEAADLKKASMQEKFQAAIEKLQDTLGRMLEGELGQLIEKFAAFVSDGKKMQALVDKIKQGFDYVKDIVKGIGGFLNVAMIAAKAYLAVSVGIAVANFIAGMSLGGPISAAAGVLAGAGLYAYLRGLGQGTPPTVSAETSTPPSLNSTTAASSDSSSKDSKKQEPERALSFMTKPVNPATAAATAAATTSDTATNAQSLNSNTAINLKVELDGQPLYSNVKNRMEQDQGLKKR